ncbi:unnamed protein product [Allacma fusca]|uniref:Uncharacterized protein n=1 Tax=Allacma fusca TaxID=39272 RepID=A0A8J2PES0_9HEXA|nr:unnamed protein product [Allacma fusca]
MKLFVLILSVLVSGNADFSSSYNGWKFETISDTYPFFQTSRNVENQVLDRISDLFPAENPLDQLRLKIRNQLRNYIEEVQDVHTPDQLSATSRQKRETIRADKLVSTGRRRRNYASRPYELSPLEEGSSLVVKRIYLMSKPSFTSPNITDLNLINHAGNLYAFVVDNAASSTIILKIDSNWNVVEIGRLYTPGAITCEVFRIEGYIYALPTSYDPIDEETLEGGSTLYRIDLTPSFRAISVQTINTQNAKSISFWRSSGVAANDVILCVAPEKQVTERGVRYQVDVSCYRWQGGYFDLTYLIPAYSPQALQYMSISSHNYLCIANYMDDTGSTKVYSTILRYSHKMGNYVPFQKILTYGARDCQYFRFDSPEQTREHYLAIANFGEADKGGKINYNVKSYIFKYGIGRFILFQSIVTFGAFQMLPITDGRKFLLIVAELNRLSVYQHNGWNFVKTRHIDFPDEQLANQFRMRTVINGGPQYFTAASPNIPEDTGIYGIEFEPKNDYMTISSDLKEWCQQAVEIIENTNLPQLVRDASSVPNVTEPEIITKGLLTFNSPLRVQNVFTQSLTYEGSTFDSDRSKSLSRMEQRIKTLEMDIRTLIKQLENVLMLDGSQTMKTPLKFSSWIVSDNSKISTKDLNVVFINQIDVKTLLQRIIFLDGNYHIPKLTIRILNTTHAIEGTYLSGKKIADMILKSVEYTQTLKGNNAFLLPVVLKQGLHLKGYLNDVNISDIVTSNPAQYFREVKIDDSIVRNLNATYINGVNIAHILTKSVRKYGYQEIHGKKSFKHVKISSIWAEPLLSGFNIPEIYSNVVWKENLTESSFGGHPVYESVSITNLSLKDELINDKYNLSEFLSITSGPLLLKSWTVYGDLNYSNLNVISTINYLDLKQFLLKNSTVTQSITGHSLDTILLKTDAILQGTINKIDITKWNATEMIELEHIPSNGGNIVAEKVSFARDVTVQKKFTQEGHDVLPILDYLIPLDSASMPCKPSSITFEYATVVGNAEISSLNKESPNDWVNRNDSKAVTIDARKHFYNNVTFLSPVTSHALYLSMKRELEILTLLQKILLNGTDQVIYGAIDFNKTLYANNLWTSEPSKLYLDGVPLDTIVLTKAGQHIRVNSYSNFVKANSLEVQDNIKANSINEIDLKDSWNDTLRTVSSTTQVLIGQHNFQEGLFLLNVRLLGTIGSYHLGDLLSNIVINGNSNQNYIDEVAINGSLRFDQAAKLKYLDFILSMNGITPDQWGTVWLTKLGSQRIDTPFHFLGDLKVEEAFVTDHQVSGIDIQKMSEEIFRKNQNGYIGTAFFNRDVNFASSVCSTDFNGFNPEKDFLRKSLSSLQIVTGWKVFLSNWEITGNLEARNIPGLNWDKLIDFVTGNSNQTVSLKIHGDCGSYFEPGPPETINGIEWRDLMETAWFRNQNTTFKGEVHFDNLHFPKGTVLGLIDGVDVVRLESEYLSRTKNQSWIRDFVFEGRVCANDIEADEVIIKSGRLNGIEIESFPVTVLRQDVEQHIGTQVNFNKLHVAHLNLSNINGMDFCKDFVRLHGENRIQSTKNIEQLEVDYLYLEPDAKVSGIELNDWRSKSVLLLGNFTLEGDRYFDFARFRHLIVAGFVDGEVIDKNTVLRLSGNQTGVGNFTFDGLQLTKFSDIFVYGSLSGYDLDSYFKNLVVKNGSYPINFYGKLIFEQDVSAAWLKAEGSYQQNGTQLQDFVANYDPHVYTNNSNIHNRYESIRDATLGLIHVATERAVLSQCFEKSNPVLVANVVNLKVTHPLQHPSLVLVSERSDGQQVQWETYNTTTDRYEPNIILPFTIHGNVEDIGEIKRGNEYFVFASISSTIGQNVTTELPVQPANTDFLLSDPSGKLSKGYVWRLTTLASGTLGLVIHQVVFADIFGKLNTFSLVTSSGSIVYCVLFSALNENKYSARSFCFQPTDLSGINNISVHPVQKFPLNGFPLLTSMTVENKTLVIMSEDFSDGKGKLWEYAKLIKVWAHNQSDDNYLVEEDQFPVINVVAIDAIQAPNYHPFLVVVSGGVKHSAHQGLVYIYKYSTSQQRFLKFQTILEDNAVDAKFQRIEPSDELFLYIRTGNTVNNVKVYVFKGVAGWNEEYVFTVPGSDSIETSEFYYQNEYRAQILTTSQKEVNVYDVHFNGNPFVPAFM